MNSNRFTKNIPTPKLIIKKNLFKRDFIMVGGARIELAANWLKARCSTTELPTHWVYSGSEIGGERSAPFLGKGALSAVLKVFL